VSIRLDKLLSQRGYCSRSGARNFLQHSEVKSGEEIFSDPAKKVAPEQITIDGEAIDPAPGLVLIIHKPCGYICSHADEGELIYELLPERFQCRNPPLSTVGRLDKDTSGLLLITDNGDLLHRLTSPKYHLPRVYSVTLEQPLQGNESQVFGSGTFVLPEEEQPLKPAHFEVSGANSGVLTIHEGRYRQVRRMFGALGNLVTELHRKSFGPIELSNLKPGEWRFLNADELALLNTRPVKL